MNHIVIMGRLTKDPEMKVTKSGVEFATFSVAVDRRVAKDAEKQSDFFDCIVWRGGAATVSKYFHKGDGIAVEGSMQNNPYRGDDGKSRQSWNLVVDEFHFPPSKKSSSTEAPAFTEVSSTEDGDLPF